MMYNLLFTGGTVDCPLQWCHNECDGVSNHQPCNCFFFNYLFRRRSKKTSKLHVTGFGGGGIQRWPVKSLHNGPVTWKTFPFDDVIMVIKNSAATSDNRIGIVTSESAISWSIPTAGYEMSKLTHWHLNTKAKFCGMHLQGYSWQKFFIMIKTTKLNILCYQVNYSVPSEHPKKSPRQKIWRWRVSA